MSRVWEVIGHGVEVIVGVEVGVPVSVGVLVFVGVPVEVDVEVAVGVLVMVDVSVAVGVGVAGWQPVTVTSSIWSVPPPLEAFHP
jgi:hypothetical protein